MENEKTLQRDLPLVATTVSAFLTTLKWRKLKLRNKNTPNRSTSILEKNKNKQTLLYMFLCSHEAELWGICKRYILRNCNRNTYFAFTFHICQWEVAPLGLDVAGPTATPDSSKANRVILTSRLHSSSVESPTIICHKSLTRVESRSDCSCCDGNKPAKI